MSAPTAADFVCFCGEDGFDDGAEIARHLTAHDRRGEDAGDFHDCASCEQPIRFDDIDAAGNGVWVDRRGSSSCRDSATERHSA